ncbi:MAG: hypothetical protein JW801_07660 [Bacteroidales bacterium]|nr:hypothetical protein [Bacteroidales bacterium]
MNRLNLLKIVLGLSFLILAVQGKSQAAMDTIFKIEGKVMPVDVIKVTPTYVSFVVPGNAETFTIERKQIQKIVYKNGRVEEYNKPVFEMIDDYSWEAVWLTEDKKDVADLYRRGAITAESPSSSRSHKAAKKNATIRLQKKAAAMKGTVVYVTKKMTTGGYGESPGYYYEGEVYGLEPLEEDEAGGSVDGDVVL